MAHILSVIMTDPIACFVKLTGGKWANLLANSQVAGLTVLRMQDVMIMSRMDSSQCRVC